MSRFPEKEDIKNNFSRAAGTYDRYSDLQRMVGEELLVYHLTGPGLPRDPERLIDIGCGTGRLLNALLGMYPHARFAACDIALPMTIMARERVNSGRAKLVTSDFESLSFKDSTFDIAVSNLAYQWVIDAGGAFGEVFKVLKPGGIFAFSTLGPLTFRELKESVRLAENATGRGGLPPLMEFRGVEAVERRLVKEGFTDVRIKNEPVQKSYRDMWAFLKALKAIGAGANPSGGDKTLAKGSLLKEAARIYRERFPSPDGSGVVATYDVVYVSARRP